MCSHVHAGAQLRSVAALSCPVQTYPMPVAQSRTAGPSNLRRAKGISFSALQAHPCAPLRCPCLEPLRSLWPCQCPEIVSAVHEQLPSQHMAGPKMPVVISTAGTMVCIACMQPLAVPEASVLGPPQTHLRVSCGLLRCPGLRHLVVRAA